MVSSVSVGMVVAGRYTLERCLNTGGIGSLWLARDEQNDSACGLRLAESSGQGVVELAARYLTEVDVVGRIRCENIVDILDYGEWNGMPFLVVEHIEGEDLSATLIHKGSMQPKAAYRIIAQTARALARAHAAGIVHGDLTPEHILITSDGMQPMAKVFNFGLSQRGGEAGGTKSTRIGSFLRMPHYSSPEQITGKEADSRSDLWALAVICYECLVGKKPFDSNAFGDLVANIMVDPVPPIQLPGGRTPAALQGWWDKAMSRDPTKRFQTAKEMSDALGKAFGFPLVFVPEPSASSVGPHPSPASLPIALRDSSAPPPSKEVARAVTSNPKLKPAPPYASSRPPQVAVRSNSPVPGVVSRPAMKYERQSTKVGLGVSSTVEPKPSHAPRLDARSGQPIPSAAFDSQTFTKSEPPSSLKIDVDVDIPSTAFAQLPVQPVSVSLQRDSLIKTSGEVSGDIEPALEQEPESEGFPPSEAPTVARKTTDVQSASSFLSEDTSDDSLSDDDPLNEGLTAPHRTRHLAAWITAAAIVVVGSVVAMNVVRSQKKHPRPTTASSSILASSDAPTPTSAFAPSALTNAEVDAAAGSVAEGRDVLATGQGKKADSDSTPEASAHRATAESKASRREAQSRLKPTERVMRDNENVAEKAVEAEKAQSNNQFPTTPTPVESSGPTPASTNKVPAPGSSVTNKPAKAKAPSSAGHDYGI